jgi:hypothetical protein
MLLCNKRVLIAQSGKKVQVDPRNSIFFLSRFSCLVSLVKLGKCNARAMQHHLLLVEPEAAAENK